MARPGLSTESSKVYVGMLIFTCLAMLVGIGVMVLEGGEYDWVRKPATTPEAKLPPPPKPEANASVSPTVTVAEAPKPIAEPAAVPAPLPTRNLSPAPVAVVEAPKPIEANPPEAAPLALPPGTGPIPSPLVIPR